ncbi:NAD(P)H-dependent oxidoreductase [Leptolyngbya cf. ectocarpi LEGE 11479]|uniref:NAD(P)H-dependent oxidoreductase n=1 Tax=Leptolyngbya cf. ectocarpi LEGE 11479 TaxID=1828722 RepID=A0A929FD14_LEPEC|nr:NAD(P)H-dependent oxidoreductase [Leptolyngbya ectocarpi]MBE9070642.1 NAD(P)H-dependent oxidoreductase [Leptolyngbya cf. ectocarpi LEGE 11479]
MNALHILFVDCTLKPSPELSETGALWTLLAERYQAKDHQIKALRPVDFNILPGHSGDPDDDFLQVFDRIQAADILILGVSALQGQRSSECQKLMERLRETCHNKQDLATGQSPLYNKVVGVLLVGDTWGSGCLGQICCELGQLGCVNPPYNTAVWCQPIDTPTGFMEAKGNTSATVNRDVRLVVEHTIAMAHLIRQTPLQINLKAVNQEVQTITKAAAVATDTILLPPLIHAENTGEGIDYRQVSKRIWTVMQAGRQRGFCFSVLSLEDKIFRAERNNKGFIYKIYPGYFSYRNQYANYDLEKSKAHKLTLMAKIGLPVPVSYGTFKTVAEIPFETLKFPLVAKPDAGSLSENVYPNLQTAEQLRQAAAVIETSDAVSKLESHISGQDYRVLIINHHYAGCVQRRPASVVGDGQRTILELFQRRNQEPGRCDRYETHTTLHQLVFDHTSRRLLHRAGYTLNTVLAEGEVFYLQEKITAALGADYIDCTDDLHPSIVQQCIEFSHHYPSLTIGFDLITTDICRPLAETGGAFNEYNTLPYVDLHECCNVGQQRPVSYLIWDYIEERADSIVTAEFKPF